MKRWHEKALFLFLFIIPVFSIYAQKTSPIQNIDFKIVGDKLVITYDITNYTSKDRFDIRPEIRKASGELLKASTLTGDLHDVQGGTGKMISWDLDKDNVVLNDDIYVVLFGVKIQEATPAATQKTSPNAAKTSSSATSMHTVNRAACFFQSVAFPGWGTSRLSRKNGHIVKGILGYGLLIGCVAYNTMSNNSYNEYLKTTTASDRNELYRKAKDYHTVSILFAGGAAAIWTIDLVTVLATKNRTIKPSASVPYINIGYSMAVANTHQVVFKLNF